MTTTVVDLAGLQALPRAERRPALAALVACELRAVLQMAESEPLPANQSYFDLGLTSLSVEELKQRLEKSLGCRVDAEVLFNHPTVEHLLAHLESGPLQALFAQAAGAPPSPPSADAHERSLVDEMLQRLYQT
jgi:acyl carrier protein